MSNTVGRDTTPELIQFHYSHFNEKARWALDYKGIAHVRTSLLPGPHARTVRRMTGQTFVPVLRVAGSTVAGSADIIAELERRDPDPPLYPNAADERDQALAIQQRFDDEVGPQVRRALFSVLVWEPAFMTSMFACDRSVLVRFLYQHSFPLVRGLMGREMGLFDDPLVAESFEGTRQAFDFVAERSAATGYLVGERFSVADLTAAALLAPAADPLDSPMTKPHPRPASLNEWHARWQDHPGAAWVREQYRKHRPASAAVAA